MTRTAEEIRAAYALAAIAPRDPAEIEAMAGHFDKMFRHLEDLKRIPVDGVEPYFALPLRDLPLDADTIRPSGDAEAIRVSFSSRDEGFLVVPRVVTRGEEE